MRVLAFDPSISKTGFCLAVDDVPESCGVLKPPSKLKTQRQKLAWYGAQVRSLAIFTRPDLVVIEECGPQRNAQTFRALVRAEAICDYECSMVGVNVLLVMVKAVREVAMGDGKMGKETVYAKLRAQYPNFEWKEFEKGGNDMSDAMAMAIAGRRLAERV